jgi:ribosome biogenesis protein Nip4
LKLRSCYALNSDKFHHVQRLELEVYKNVPFYLELVRRTAPYLLHVSLGIEDVEGELENFWEALRGLRSLEIKA